MESYIVGFIVSIFLGALIGLQREHTQQNLKIKSFAGIRTFILVTFFGAIMGFFGENINSTWAILGFVSVVLFSLSSYVVTYMKSKKISATTQIVFVMSYILGAMCTTSYLQLAVVFAVIIATFLTFKERLHVFAKKMKNNEIIAMIKFALIAFVVLPFLPNKNYSPLDIPGLGEVLQGIGISSSFLSQLDVFNLHNIWLMVIFIAGINLVGYFLVKIVGSKKGYGLLGFVGGLVSSTAVTLSVAEESKRVKSNFSPLILAVVIATSVSFVRIIFEVAVVNSDLLTFVIFPMGAMALSGFIYSFFFYRRRTNKKATEVPLEQPFALIPALKFGGFFALILLLARIAQILFGNVGIYATSVLSGLMDVDAITLTMSSLAKTGGVTNFVATTAIMLAAASNVLVKAGMAYFLGNKKFGKWVFAVFVGILVIGGLILIL